MSTYVGACTRVPRPKYASLISSIDYPQTERLLPIDLRGYSNLESAPPRLATRSNRAGNSDRQGVFEPYWPENTGSGVKCSCLGRPMPGMNCTNTHF